LWRSNLIPSVHDSFIIIGLGFVIFIPSIRVSFINVGLGCSIKILILANDGNQDGPSLKDPLQVSDGPIARSRAKKIKETMQGLVQSTWDEASKSPTIKVSLKEGEPILIHLIQAVEDMT
jgi:hypothetical protein